MPNDTEGEMGVESKGCKLRVIASGLCMATVMLVSVFTGGITNSGERTGLAEISVQQNDKFPPVTLLDLNDPVPHR
ncbi:hypothetical protein [Paenibacillus taichungensis]|uniref:Uncharacterized protein n=1 Tax=Paenibacillus taichungensis TaxID=484184 RepID=A0A329QL88_9BACL|nr:hypothetical protein [Paenibacillus taichungensis]RAW12182.1 hypothetical protein DC345_22965 [Paenibacillus taichungensis]